MRILLLITLLFICRIGLAQSTEATLPVDSATSMVNYKEVVESKLSKDQLYKDAQNWITSSYGNYKAVVQFEDPQQGKISLKGLRPFNDIINSQLRYTVIIEVKDKKYRYQVTNLETSYSTNYSPREWTPVEKRLDVLKSLTGNVKKSATEDLILYNTTTLNLIASLKKAMTVNDDF